jgi:hypothetical protein
MGSQEPIVIEARGHTPSKKNAYTPRKDGRGMFKNSRLQEQIDRLAIQVPPDARDLRLISPDITFEFTYVKANWDRDGAVVTWMDILVQMSVIQNDNIASCNGRIVIEPAVRGEYDSVKITLVPKE